VSEANRRVLQAEYGVPRIGSAWCDRALTAWPVRRVMPMARSRCSRWETIVPRKGYDC